MPRRNRRIDRKLHRVYLGRGIIDISQVDTWRRRLFEARLLESFLIDHRRCEGLDVYARETVDALRRYNLRYLVARVPAEWTPFEVADWHGFEIFRFQALRYPDIVAYSANNPAIP